MEISNGEFTELGKQLILPLFKGVERAPNNSLSGLSRIQRGLVRDALISGGFAGKKSERMALWTPECNIVLVGMGPKNGLDHKVARDAGANIIASLSKKNGVEVQEAYPGCCGMPLLEQADLPKVVDQAKKVSKNLLEWIDKGYKVVTLTASCGLMLKFEWPLLLPKDENIKKLSANVMDIDEYVVDISSNEGLADGLQEIDGGVTVHHACHARAQNMGIKARDMLKLIPNVKIDVVERCAGHGGTFGVMKETHDLAVKVGRPTARQIKTKNNKYMASDCPLAGKHLKQLETDTNISNDEALHPIELMAKSYKL